MLASALMRAWHQRVGWAALLLPLAVLFGTLTGVRRWLYRSGVLRSVHLPVPVIIVGNITVGGVGKTPLTLYLVEQLRSAGRVPGVVSRGYGRRTQGTVTVAAQSAAADVGDEPLLIARRSGAPVVVGSDRVAAAQQLLAQHPEVDVLVSDDGLQHYRLARAFEIAVLDSRGVMNGWLLPAGPLREPVSRLRTVDAVVCNGDATACTALAAVSPALTFARSVISMRLEVGAIYRLGDPAQTRCASEFAGTQVHAIAGIGNPGRFFAQLRALGMVVLEHPFPDHHDYQAADLPDDGRTILTTEKDAVKLAALALPGRADIWVLPVHCRLEPDTLNAPGAPDAPNALCARILEKINGSPPA